MTITTTANQRNERRYWMRAEKNRPWYPWGSLLLALLIAAFLWGVLVTAPGIEAEVVERVDDRLHGAGLNSRLVNAHGQSVNVHVVDTAISEFSVRAIAEEARCVTWAGSLKCPSNVTVEVSRPAEERPQAPQRHPFTIYRDDNTLTLTGDVPSRSEFERFTRWGEGLSREIINNLAVTGVPATSSFHPSSELAMSIVPRLLQGQVTWTGETLSVLGFAGGADLSAAADLFTRADALGIRGDFDVRELREAQDCNRAFSDLLNENRILFATGSAVIQPSNSPLLAEIAAMVKACPGELTVEGHTDNQGNPDANKSLSRERALAVRDALGELGVDLERVVAIGYGEERPVAGNATASGRAQNRRITVSVNVEE